MLSKLIEIVAVLCERRNLANKGLGGCGDDVTGMMNWNTGAYAMWRGKFMDFVQVRNMSIEDVSCSMEITT